MTVRRRYADELAAMMEEAFRLIDDPAGESTYLRLSTRGIQQVERPDDSWREGALAGGYWLREPPEGAEAAIVAMGAVMPEALADGKAEGWPWVGKSIEHQFAKFSYPAPGHAPVKMLYKYGGSMLATMNNTNRHVRMYQSDRLEFVVNQSIWFEGEAKFADVILPACTNFERVDISEWAGLGGYGHHGQQQLNHRVIIFQAPAINGLAAPVTPKPVVVTATTDANGNYSASVTPNQGQTGTWSVKSSYAGDDAHTGSDSTSCDVKVGRPAPVIR